MTQSCGPSMGSFGSKGGGGETAAATTSAGEAGDYGVPRGHLTHPVAPAWGTHERKDLALGAVGLQVKGMMGQMLLLQAPSRQLVTGGSASGYCEQT